MALIDAVDLVAGYVPGVNILNGASLTLEEGEIVGIIGPNGAGKSTLLKAMFGLVDIRDGDLTMRGQSIRGRRADELVGLGIGYVPQSDNVFPRLTVRENLEMGCFQQPKLFDSRFAAVVDLFPLLADRAGQRAGSLSGGERQMVAMGRALMMDPSVILLDEPSAGLSPAFQSQVFKQVTVINKAGVSVVMVEQNARRCLEICNRAYVLDQGRNAHTGTGQELMHDEKVIELYLGSLAVRD
ncbi:MAG: ABC transporter ATP-binding protein [Acidimicrobiales bacterium]